MRNDDESIPRNRVTKDLAFAAETAKVAMRFYYSTKHQWAARFFAQQCRRREQELLELNAYQADAQHQTYSRSAVLSAVAFVESRVNEALQDISDSTDRTINGQVSGVSGEVADKINQWWTGRDAPVKAGGRKYIGEYDSTLEKLQESLHIAKAGRFVKTDEPFKAGSVLIELRNELVHFKPSWREIDEPHSLEEYLRHHITSSGLDIGEPWFENQCFGAGLADWACDVAEDLMKQWSERLGFNSDFDETFAAMPDLSGHDEDDGQSSP